MAFTARPALVRVRWEFCERAAMDLAETQRKLAATERKLEDAARAGLQLLRAAREHESAAAEAGYIIFRLLSNHRIAFSTRRISFEHHPFLGVMNLLFINY